MTQTKRKETYIKGCKDLDSIFTTICVTNLSNFGVSTTRNLGHLIKQQDEELPETVNELYQISIIKFKYGGDD